MNNNKEKFSKNKLAINVWERINEIEEQYRFKSYYGWSQAQGKGETTNRAYGEYECLLSIANEYNLKPF